MDKTFLNEQVKHVEELNAKAARETNSSLEALQFSQAALNLANAIAVLCNTKP